MTDVIAVGLGVGRQDFIDPGGQLFGPTCEAGGISGTGAFTHAGQKSLTVRLNFVVRIHQGNLTSGAS
jgi:hypothetical protein